MTDESQFARRLAFLCMQSPQFLSKQLSTRVLGYRIDDRHLRDVLVGNLLLFDVVHDVLLDLFDFGSVFLDTFGGGGGQDNVRFRAFTGTFVRNTNHAGVGYVVMTEKETFELGRLRERGSVLVSTIALLLNEDVQRPGCPSL